MSLTLCHLTLIPSPRVVYGAPTAQEDLKKVISIESPPLHTHVPALKQEALTPEKGVKPLTVPMTHSAKGELLVVEMTPKETLSTRYKKIHLTFSHPMVRIDQQGAQAQINASFSPKIRGRWEWTNSKTATFTPKDAWADSTRYIATLRGPLLSIDGASLGQTFQIRTSLETQRIRPSYINFESVSRKGQYINKGATPINILIKVCFNMPPVIEGLTDHIHLTSRSVNAQPQRAPLSYIGAARKKKCAYFRPQSNLQPNTKYEVEVRPKITTSRGNLKSQRSLKDTFHTYAPLVVEKVYTGSNPTEGPFYIKFSNPVPKESVQGRVRVSAIGQTTDLINWDQFPNDNRSYRGLDQKKRTWKLPGTFLPNTNYHLDIVPKNVTDIYQQKLILTQRGDAPLTRWTLKTSSYSPFFSGYLSRGLLESIDLPRVRLSYRNLKELCLKWYMLNPEQVAQYNSNTLFKPKDLARLPATERVCFDMSTTPEKLLMHHFPMSPVRFPEWGSTPKLSPVGTPTISDLFQKRAPTVSPISPISQRAKSLPATSLTPSKVEGELPDCPRLSPPPLSSLTLPEWIEKQVAPLATAGSHFYLLESEWSWRSGRKSYSDIKRKDGPCDVIHSNQKRTLLQLSQLGLQSKLSPLEISTWVWDLKTGQARPDAEVRLLGPQGRVLLEGRTDAQGIATLSFDALSPESPLQYQDLFNEESWTSMTLLATTADGDATFTSLRAYEGISEERYSWTSLDRHERERGAVWTDRGIYRPEEEVYLSGVLAVFDVNGSSPINAPEAEITVLTPHYETLFTQAVKVNHLGRIHHRFTLPKNVKLGDYKVSVKVKQNDRVWGKSTLNWSTSFKIAEFRTPRFLVNAQIERSEGIIGDEVKTFVEGRYLYDAPMKEKSWVMRVDTGVKSRFYPVSGKKSDEYGSYDFGINPDYRSSNLMEEVFGEEKGSRYISRKRGILDQYGKAEAQVKLIGHLGLKTLHMINYQVTDDDQQDGSAYTIINSHPASVYIGLHPHGELTPSNKPISVDLIAVDALSEARSALDGVEVALYREAWNTSYYKDEIGRQRSRSQRELIKEGTCSLLEISKTAKATCQLKTSGSGYHIWVATAKDERGREVIALDTQWVYASAGGTPASFKVQDGSNVKIQSPKSTYSPGEVMQVMVESPYVNAEAWISVEQRGVLFQKRISYRSGDLIEIPITESMIPSAHLVVTLVKPRVEAPGRPGDLGRPSMRYGRFSFSVNNHSQHIDLTLTPDHPTKRPGETLTLTLEARGVDAEPVSGEAVVWAVDKGITSLTGYAPPTLLDTLYKRGHDWVLNHSNLRHLLEHLSDGEKGHDVGGGGGDEEDGAAKNVRKKFIPTPIFVETVTIGPEGRATVEAQLPDNLTTFDLFAVMIAPDRARSSTTPQSRTPFVGLRAGNAQSEVVVNKPLMVRPALPRALTVGDRFLAGVTLNSVIDAPVQVTLKGVVSGGARALTPIERDVLVPAVGSIAVRFPFEATQEERARFKFSIEGIQTDGAQGATPWRDAVELELVVNPKTQREVQASYGEANPSAIEGLQLPKNLKSATLNLTLNSTALAGFLGEAQVLLDYPYGCLEQQLSRLLPYALYRPFEERFKTRIAVPKDGKSATLIIQETLATLSDMQRTNGGFRYWPNNTSSIHPWGSAYGLMVFHELKRAGYDVSMIKIDKLVKYLKEHAFAITKRDEENPRADLPRGHLESAAFIAYIFARYEAPLISVEEVLYKRRSELAFFGQSLFVSALSIHKDKPSIGTRKSRAIKLMRRVLDAIHIDNERVTLPSTYGYQYYFHSTDRDLALLLQALIHTEPEHPFVRPILKSLLNARRAGGQLKNTQASAFALIAARDFMQILEGTTPNFIAQVSALYPVQGQSTPREALMLSQAFKEDSLTPFKWSHSFTDSSATSTPATSTPDLGPSLAGLSGLSIKRQGSGRLYYEAQLISRPAEIPTTPHTQGIRVQRDFFLRNSATSTAQEEREAQEKMGTEAQHEKKRSHAFQVGDLIEVQLSIECSGNRFYVVVNDPIPSGLEIIDPALKSISEAPNFSGSQGWSIFDHAELRNDRVLLFADEINPGKYYFSYLARATTAGTFSRVPVRAEEMYAPDISGRSDGGLLWVYPKAKP